MGDTATTPEAMIDEYCERVHRFAAMVSRGDQDSSDLAQEALARALRRFASYDPARGPLSAWLWTIVVNVARDAGRVKVRQSRLLDRLRRDDGGAAEVASLAVRRVDGGEG